MSEGPNRLHVILKGNCEHPLPRQRCLAKTVQNLLIRASLFFFPGENSGKKSWVCFPQTLICKCWPPAGGYLWLCGATPPSSCVFFGGLLLIWWKWDGIPSLTIAQLLFAQKRMGTISPPVITLLFYYGVSQQLTVNSMILGLFKLHSNPMKAIFISPLSRYETRDLM